MPKATPLFFKDNSRTKAPGQAQRKAQRKEGGFTLVEVALALIVVSLIMVPYIQIYRQYINDQIKTESNGYLKVVQSALEKYALRYGRYPMPANPSLGPGAPAGFGQEVVLATIGACTAASLDVCRTTAAWAAAPDNTVLVGAVPFAALGLPQKYATDGYKNKFKYAVTEALTVTAKYADNGGIIKVVNAIPGQNTSGTNQNVHYVVLSHGRDRKGAFTLAGTQTIPCDLAIASVDNENCNNDATFTDNFDLFGVAPNQKFFRKQVDVDGPNHYDDYIAWTTSTDSDIWTKTVLTGTSDIFNRDLGNVRIGNGPDPVARLEIYGGDFKADSLRTDRLCPNGAGTCPAPGNAAGLVAPAYPPNVFDPGIIAGTPSPANANKLGGGIDCGTNVAMTGIANSNEECNLSAFPTAYSIGGPCPTGTAAHKIVAGQLVCVAP